MAKKGARTIMVGVRELDTTSHELLRKAAALARRYQATLHLVHVIASPSSALRPSLQSVRAAANQQLQEQRTKLAGLARSAQLRKVRATASVAWGYPVAEVLARMVKRHRPRLLLVESRRRGRLSRLWLGSSDWDLIRLCPCPLWLSKTKGLPEGRSVVAALDPYHANAKPAALDKAILGNAIEAAHGDLSRVVAAHVQFVPPVSVSEGPIEAYWPALSDEERAIYRKDALVRMRKITAPYELPQQNVLIIQGDPSFHLPRIAARQQAAVLVMGAVSRSALQRAFIGSTAERVLDRASCDVLVVKPRGFKPTLGRQPVRVLHARV